MKVSFDDPYVKLCTLKAVEKYGTTANEQANAEMLKKFSQVQWRLREVEAVKKAYGVRFDRTDITMNLAAAMAALEILKKGHGKK